MVYLSVAILTILAVELIYRFQLMVRVNQLSETLKKVVKVILSKSISDHWKEKVLLIYSKRIALITLNIAAIIAGIGLVFMVLARFFDWIFSLQVSTVDFLMSWLGICIATVSSIAYLLVSHRNVP